MTDRGHYKTELTQAAIAKDYEQIEAAKAAIAEMEQGPSTDIPHDVDIWYFDRRDTIIAAAPALVRRVQELEDWQAKALGWLEKVRDSLTPLKNGDYLDDSEGIQYELGEIKKLEALIAQGGRG